MFDVLETTITELGVGITDIKDNTEDILEGIEQIKAKTGSNDRLNDVYTATTATAKKLAEVLAAGKGKRDAIEIAVMGNTSAINLVNTNVSDIRHDLAQNSNYYRDQVVRLSNRLQMQWAWLMGLCLAIVILLLGTLGLAGVILYKLNQERPVQRIVLPLTPVDDGAIPAKGERP